MGRGSAELSGACLFRSADPRAMEALRRDRRRDAYGDDGEEPDAALPRSRWIPGGERPANNELRGLLARVSYGTRLNSPLNLKYPDCGRSARAKSPVAS